MSQQQQSPRTIGLTYHPGGTGTSPSLARARKPFRIGNAAIGVALLGFVIGVYTYSIAAVKQDDFSDVEDLLPPLHARAGIRSIEDEERELLASTGASASYRDREVPQTSSPSALSSGIPGSTVDRSSSTPLTSTTTTTNPSTTTRNWLPVGWRRLGDFGWVQRAGLVDEKGNVLVWGAPDVDNIGRLGDRIDNKRNVGSGSRGL